MQSMGKIDGFEYKGVQEVYMTLDSTSQLYFNKLLLVEFGYGIKE